jgi:glycosyltransferase involved in cell wall biosynthesis
MKKVLFLIESLSGGGAEKVLTDIVKTLDKRIFDITVATVVDVGVYSDMVKKNCNYFSFLPNFDKCNNFVDKVIYKIKYKLLYKLPSSWVYKIFVKNNYDIEIGFVEGFATKVISNSRNKKSLKLAWVHVDPINWNYADQYFKSLEDQRESYERLDKIVCVSSQVKQAFEQKLFTGKKLVVKYNPVDSELVIKKSKENCEINKPNKILLGTIGRLTTEKGYDRLLKVAKKLKSDGINFELWILGEGQKRSEMEQYIVDNYLCDSVKLMGFQTNPYKYIKMFDLFVCSSRAEGFSLAIAEALILGIPVLSTDCAGPNELLDFGKYGKVVMNNEIGLYEGIKSLIINKSLLNEYRKKSLERKDDFEFGSSIKEIENLLI